MPKKFVQTNPCTYISLHDLSILGNTKLPDGITDLVLWYRKEGDDFWGITAKGYDVEEEAAINQFFIKVSWTYNQAENCLNPTRASEEYVDKIEGEVLEKLLGIKEKHKAVLKKKKTPGEKKIAKKEAKKDTSD